MDNTDYTPPGFLTLKGAVDLTGSRFFGSTWTGKEIRQLRRAPPQRLLRRLEDAVHKLRDLLASSKIPAIELAENGQQFRVQPSLWLSKYGRDVFNTGHRTMTLREMLQAQQEGTRDRLILVPKDQLEVALEEHIKKSGATTQQTTLAAEIKCRKWLVNLMSDGKQMTKSKADYRTEAQTIFKVSIRSFDRAWGNAIAETGNEDWSKPGRKS